MARLKYNVVVHGLSGKVGDLIVFSQRHGKTFVGKMPAISAKQSARQLAARERFLQAVDYAKAILNDPEVRALYQQRAEGDVKPFNLAIADFLKAPKISELITDAYSGAAGEHIIVNATDDTRVSGVQVSVYKADGTLIEQGNAVEDASKQWSYTTTQVNPARVGTKVVAIAEDIPGNQARMEKVL